MARIFKNIKIDGKEAFVLFDTGSLRSYIKRELASETRWKIDLTALRKREFAEF